MLDPLGPFLSSVGRGEHTSRTPDVYDRHPVNPPMLSAVRLPFPVMTIATLQNMRGLMPGWKIRMFQPATDRTVKGQVSEVNDGTFRVGTDDGHSVEFDFRQTERDRWDITITDRSGEFQPEVLDRVPSLADR
jgi:hypothetical protein